MGKTHKGGKPPGYEYWTARPGNKHGGGLGKSYKKQTHKIERQLNKPTPVELLEASRHGNEE